MLSKPEMFVQGIHSTPEILLHNIWGFMIVPKQVKSEEPRSWLSLCSLLQPYTESFYKFIGYYMIDHKNNINTWNIRKQVAGYIMFLKRKQRAQSKAKGCAEDRYHRIFNHKIESSSDLVQSNTHKSYRMLNTTDYNYKLRLRAAEEEEEQKWVVEEKAVTKTSQLAAIQEEEERQLQEAKEKAIAATAAAARLVAAKEEEKR